MPTKTKNTPEEVLLGIDHGDKRIGLAFGRSELVSPLHVLKDMDDGTAINEISRVCKENKVTKIVIGLPLDGEGKETLQSKKVRRFAKMLRIYIKLPQEFVNESDTTQESMEASLTYGMSGKSGQAIDHIAAAMILKKYIRDQS